MKLIGLIIGDVHATVEDLADCDAFANLVVDIAKETQPDTYFFLGDLYDSFAIKNVVVEAWWMKFLSRLPMGKLITKPCLIVGNHDRPGDSLQEAHALQAHADKAIIIDRPLLLGGGSWGFTSGIAVMPFYFRADEFLAAAEELAISAKTLLCHQAFVGGRYDSGLPIEQRHDPSAVDSAALPLGIKVISGHIHTPQYVGGGVWYPGSPRWRNNVSDANVDRYIYLVTFEDGVPTSIKKFPTGDTCRRIWKLVDAEGEEHQAAAAKGGDRVVVDIAGSSAYIEERRAVWLAQGARIRCFPTDRPAPKLSEAEGMDAAWVKWTKVYQPKFGTSMPELEKAFSERRIRA